MHINKMIKILQCRGDMQFKLLPHTRQHDDGWRQQLEYRIDVCRVTRGAHIEHL